MTFFFVHGLGANKRIWHPLIEALEDAGPSLAIDLPGHGEHFSPFPETIYEACMSLASLTDRQIHFVGHSLGGLIGLLFAALFPEKVSRLILLNTHYRIDLHPEIVQHSCSGNIPPHLVEQSLGPNACPGCKKFVLEEVGPIKLHPSQSGIADLAHLDLKEQSKSIRCPTLIIAGGKDPVISARKGALLSAAISNSSFVLFPDAGHYVHVEEPAQAAHAIKKFIKG